MNILTVFIMTSELKLAQEVAMVIFNLYALLTSADRIIILTSLYRSAVLQ